MAKAEQVEAGAENTTQTGNTALEVVGGEAAEAKKLSPKAKASLGIPEDMVLTWVPVGFSAEDNELINKVARARSTAEKRVPVAQVLRSLLMGAITSDVHEGWKAEVAAMPVSAPTAKRAPKEMPTDPAAIEKLIRSSETKAKNTAAAIERAKAALEAARAKFASTAGTSTESGDAVTVTASTANDESDGVVA